LNGTHQLLAYAADVNIVEENIDTMQKSTKALLDASKKVGRDMNPQKTNIIHTLKQSTPLHFLLSRHVSVLIGPSSGDVHKSKL
jgi:hypothetical protein